MRSLPLISCEQHDIYACGLQAVWFALMVFTSFLLLLPPSGFTDVWHVASRAYNSPGTDTPAWQGYQVSPFLTASSLKIAYK